MVYETVNNFLEYNSKKIVFLRPYNMGLIFRKIETCLGFIRYTGYNRLKPTAGFRI
jgi:hypothetical protein